MKYTHPTQIPMSQTLMFDWTGENIPVSSVNTLGDTYPITWADDDDLYVGTGDPLWCVINGVNTIADVMMKNDPDMFPRVTGQVSEKITGSPPHFEVHRLNDHPGYRGYGGNGPKPSGMICVDGVLYYAVQNLLGKKTPPNRLNSQHGSDATIICSHDHGLTWTPDLNPLFGDFMNQYDRQTWKETEALRSSFRGFIPMFPGSAFGGPSFVQFGRNNEHAVDDFVYAISGDQWDNGRCLRLGRVPKNKIMVRDAWEFAIPDENNSPIWQKDLTKAEPILDIEGHISLPEMVYLHTIRKYILLTWALHTDFKTTTGSELTILEADNPWGPFSLVHYEWMWYKRECCAYTPRIPLKWFNHKLMEGYIMHSGNWGYPLPTGEYKSMLHYYLPQVRKFRLRDVNNFYYG